MVSSTPYILEIDPLQVVLAWDTVGFIISCYSYKVKTVEGYRELMFVWNHLVASVVYAWKDKRHYLDVILSHSYVICIRQTLSLIQHEHLIDVYIL